MTDFESALDQRRSCQRHGHSLEHQGLNAFGNKFIDPIEILLRDSLTEMNHHRWVKWCLTGISGEAKEKLHISIFSDLIDGLLVG